MEFFAEVNNTGLDKTGLKQMLSIASLPGLCASINSVIADEQYRGVIYCSWGEFGINREEIRDGVRFTLPNCPNALAWTLTMDDTQDKIVIHCTIDKYEHDDDFVESIEQFVNDWSTGLQQALDSASYQLAN